MRVNTGYCFSVFSRSSVRYLADGIGFLFFLFFILSAFNSFSQTDKNYKNIPGVFARNPQILANKLTTDLKTDSEKVAAIYNWITHNIAYDVKKWLSFDYSAVPVEKILKDKKAIGIGYSDLFNDLCYRAGIKSISVPGYTKNKNVDIGDQLYIDDHVWNAVYIDGVWKLADACWDAGYIRYYQSTFKGRIVSKLSGGKKDAITYKPNFIPAPLNIYFLRAGFFFKIDHLPLDPLWQLDEKVTTPEQFVKDSSYYLKKYYRPDKKRYATNIDLDRMEFYAFTDAQKKIRSGMNGNRYNPRNHFGLANSYAIIADNDFREIKKNIKKDTAGVFTKCSSLMEKIEDAMMQYDSNARFVEKQKKELLANSELKKKISSADNQKLISATQNIQRTLGKQASQIRSDIVLSEEIRKNNFENLKAFRADEAFAEIKQAKKTNVADSMQLVKDIHTISDSIDNMNYRIQASLHSLDSAYNFVLITLGEYSDESELLRAQEALLIKARNEFFDDLDYEIRTIKSGLMKRKSENDLTVFHGQQFIGKYLSDKLKVIQDECNALYKYHKAKAAMLKKFKKACVKEDWASEGYNKNRNDMAGEFLSYAEPLNQLPAKFRQLKKLYESQSEKAKLEIEGYNKELSVEKTFYSTRNNIINKRSGSLLKSGNKQRKNMENELKQTDAILKKATERK